MKNMYVDDNFLAKWLSNELTYSEKAMFEKSDDYRKYVKIIEHVDTLTISALNKGKLFSAIEQDIEKETASIPLVPKWTYGVAVAVLIVLGIFFLCLYAKFPQ